MYFTKWANPHCTQHTSQAVKDEMCMQHCAARQYSSSSSSSSSIMMMFFPPTNSSIRRLAPRCLRRPAVEPRWNSHSPSILTFHAEAVRVDASGLWFTNRTRGNMSQWKAIYSADPFFFNLYFDISSCHQLFQFTSLLG